MANTDEKWYFTKEQLENSPSRQCGMEGQKELSYRQQAANFIQDMGQRLKVSQLCINTAIVYMHRFFVFHSFTHFHWASIAAAAIFLAAKVEEQPRKLEHVIRYASLCKNPHETKEMAQERFHAQSQDLVFNENILLQTLGFDVAIDHPHTHVVRCCHLVRASKDLAQTSYFMASNSLHLTTMCLQYKPTVVACFCIHLVCKWSNWEIPLSNEKREWFTYVDPTVTADLLKHLTEEFLTIFERCPSRLKEKIMANGAYEERKDGPIKPLHDSMKIFPPSEQQQDPHKHRPRPHEGSGGSGHADCREKKEAERSARAKALPTMGKPTASLAVHHRVSSGGAVVDPSKMKHGRPLPPSSSSFSMGHPAAAAAISARSEPHRDILREAARDIGLKDHKEHGREVKPSSQLFRDVRNDKELTKRDSVNKPNISDSASYLDKVNFAHDKRLEPLKTQRSGANDLNVKHVQHKYEQQQQQHDDTKMYLKNENEIKKHLNSGIYDKNVFITKPLAGAMSSSPMPKTTDPNVKSVQNKYAANAPIVKQEVPNGSSTLNSSYSLPFLDESKVKQEFKDESTLPAKKPSLFSPEKSPPRRRTPPPNPAKPLGYEFSQTHCVTAPLPALSPLESSPEHRRRRTASNSSTEPELRPVIKKIDQVEGYENVLRDSGIKMPKHQVPEMIAPIADAKPTVKDISKELKPPELIKPFNPPVQPLTNGIETNVALISNLLKETTVPSHLTVSEEKPDNREHHHKDRKKKNKEKHKHKDKDRSKEEKEKKKKHKDKDKEKHKSKEKETPTQPIKIFIPKDKIRDTATEPAGTGLKIKIPKDRIKTDSISTDQQASAAPIRIKIPKDVIGTFSGVGGGGEAKKRERDRSSSELPPSKVSRSYNRASGDAKVNGRNPYGKVSKTNDISRRQRQVQQQQMHQQQHHFNDGMQQSMVMQQQSLHHPMYMYPPPSVPNMNAPPPSHYMYNYLYNSGYGMYPAQGIYPVHPPPLPQTVDSLPPLPNDAPPLNPPPPPLPE